MIIVPLTTIKELSLITLASPKPCRFLEERRATRPSLLVFAEAVISIHSSNGILLISPKLLLYCVDLILVVG